MNKTYYWIAGAVVVILLLLWYMQSSLASITASLTATQAPASGTASTLIQTPANTGINAKNVVPETAQGAQHVVIVQGATPPRNATRIANNPGISNPTIGN